MNNDPRFKPFDQLVYQYLDQEVTAEQFQRLTELLTSSPTLRRRFVRLSALDYAIDQLTDQHDRRNTIQAALDEVDPEPKEDELSKLFNGFELPPDNHQNLRPRWRDAPGLIAYVAGQALRDHRLVKFLVAASLALGVAIYFSLGGNRESPDATGPAINTPQANRPAPRAAMVPVATLTYEHNAVWDRRPGQDLYAGQRFTLTAGFAEITTERGAVAIIQAPATFELLDNDNALRLHTGKLVGICETDASKGFVVRTPHMDITDLGTRFGVDASDRNKTSVSVFDGEVEVAEPTELTAKPTALVAGQSAHAGKDSKLVTSDEIESAAFASLLPESADLPHTGLGLSPGQADPAWSIVRIDGKDLATPLHPVVEHPRRRPDPQATLDPAQWISWRPPADAEKQAEVYLFETRINLPDDLAPDAASLDLQYVVDNRLIAIIVNGHRVPVTETGNPLRTTRHRIQAHLVPGENVIGFELYNAPKPGGPSPNNTVGLRLTWQVLSSDTPAWREAAL